jgi:Flp pilus assembly protein TadB
MRFKMSSSTKVTDEQRRLEKQHGDLVRRQQELEKALRTIPKQNKKKKELQTIRVEATMSSRVPGVAQFSRVQMEKRRKTLPARELQNARIKFLCLCLLLATIIIMLWRAIPS